MRRRITLTFAVMPLIVLVGLRSAWAAYACSIDGKIRDACCCPRDGKSQQPADGAPRIAPPDCCDMTLGDASETPDIRESDRLRLGDLPPAASEPALLHRPPAPTCLRRAGKTWARPPPSSIPTYLANNVILR